MNWDDFSEFYDWELELVNSKQNNDISFWQEVISKYGDPILELACGSGRITLPLLNNGYRITAIDSSSKMLEKLIKRVDKKYIEENILEIIQADMRNFKLPKKFNFVLIGYFALQLLTKLEDQIKCLKNIHKHLNNEGILGLDIYPCVCEGYDNKEKEMIYSRIFSDDKVNITMYSSYEIDRLNLIKHWSDEYHINSINQKKVMYHNKISLKECSPDYMELLLAKTGFKIIEIYGSFNKKIITKDSENILYLCKKR